MEHCSPRQPAASGKPSPIRLGLTSGCGNALRNCGPAGCAAACVTVGFLPYLSWEVSGPNGPQSMCPGNLGQVIIQDGSPGQHRSPCSGAALTPTDLSVPSGKHRLPRDPQSTRSGGCKEAAWGPAPVSRACSSPSRPPSDDPEADSGAWPRGRPCTIPVMLSQPHGPRQQGAGPEEPTGASLGNRRPIRISPCFYLLFLLFYLFYFSPSFSIRVPLDRLLLGRT